ncbi:MAG: FHA domain-containing protein [Sedimentisphaerales bacterium]|nr:FHA domain-containing protein [Sedimentisphaerales bacterium]
MELTVRLPDGSTQEYQFDKGPVYIGRQMGSTIFLPALSVSRQHAVLFTTTDNQWILEDLDSANKTYLNDTAIHKSRIQDGDVIRITEYQLDVSLDSIPQPSRDIEKQLVPETKAQDEDRITLEFEPQNEAVSEAEKKPVHMEDTMVIVHHDVTIVDRKIDTKTAEEIHLPVKRFGDLDRAAATFCRVRDLKELHRGILEVTIRQLHAYRAWACLRKDPEDKMEIEGGRDITTIRVERRQLVMQEIIENAVEKGLNQLVPQIPRQINQGRIRSAIVAPVLRDVGCYGVLYAENSTDHEHYSQQDLDYLILISILVAAVIDKA